MPDQGNTITVPAVAADPSLEALPLASGHIPALDGLRGLAILLVLVEHFAWQWWDASIHLSLGARIFNKVAGIGWCGVDLFFVLSGFLITGILIDAKKTPHYFRNFYARRTLRIFPLYYGVLLATFVIAPLLLPHRTAPPGQQAWAWCYATNIYAVRTGTVFQGPNVLNFDFVHFWSLAVEEHFYLLWPTIVLVCGRRSLMWVCGGLMLGALSLRGYILYGTDWGYLPAYVFTGCRMDALALGGLLAAAARGPRGLLPLLKIARWAMPISAAALAVLFVRSNGLMREDPQVTTLGFTLLAIFFGAMLVMTVASPRTGILGRVFRRPALLFLGKISYGLYVFHKLLSPWFDRYFGRELLFSRGHGFFFSVGVHFIAATAISIAVAWASYHLFEKRFLMLKRFFEYRTPNS